MKINPLIQHSKLTADYLRPIEPSMGLKVFVLCFCAWAVLTILAILYALFRRPSDLYVELTQKAPSFKKIQDLLKQNPEQVRRTEDVPFQSRPIEIAVISGSKEIVQEMIKACPDSLKVLSAYDGYTLVQLAIMFQRLDILKLLLLKSPGEEMQRKGAWSNSNYTPLEYAIHSIEVSDRYGTPDSQAKAREIHSFLKSIHVADLLSKAAIDPNNPASRSFFRNRNCEIRTCRLIAEFL